MPWLFAAFTATHHFLSLSHATLVGQKYRNICKISHMLPDIVDRVFERRIHDLVSFLRDSKPFGYVEAGAFLCYAFAELLRKFIIAFIFFSHDFLFTQFFFPSIVHSRVSKARVTALPPLTMGKRRLVNKNR